MDATSVLRSAAALGLLTFTLASGCVAVAAGAAAGYAGVEYAAGECVGVAGATVDKTYHATLAAAEQLQMTLRSKNREATAARFTFRQPDGTFVDIGLGRQNVDFTRITVRVGTFGDEARSRAIIKKIKENI